MPFHAPPAMPETAPLPDARPDIPAAFRVYADRLGYAYCLNCTAGGRGRAPLDVFDAKSAPWCDETCDACGAPFLAPSLNRRKRHGR